MDAKFIADEIASMLNKRNELRARVSPDGYAAAVGPFRRQLRDAKRSGAANLAAAVRIVGRKTPECLWCLLSAAFIDEMISETAEVN